MESCPPSVGISGRFTLEYAGSNAHVDIAVLEVESPQQFSIGFDPVRIVDVAGLQKGEKAGRGRLDDVLEPIRGIGAIANEVDLPDPRSWHPR